MFILILFNLSFICFGLSDITLLQVILGLLAYVDWETGCMSKSG